VIANFERIDKEYSMEEPFSAKDQIFIEMYAKKPEEMTSFASKSISGSTHLMLLR